LEEVKNFPLRSQNQREIKLLQNPLNIKRTKAASKIPRERLDIPMTSELFVYLRIEKLP
jgi:hypothetical protein